MNRIKWYSHDIWNPSSYDRERSLCYDKNDWVSFLKNDNKSIGDAKFGKYYYVLNKVLVLNKGMAINFLNIGFYSYYIDADILLTSKKEDIVKVKGISIYMGMRRLLRFINKNNMPLTKNSIIKKAHVIFPLTASRKDLIEILQMVLNYSVSDDNENQKIWNKVIRKYFKFIISPASPYPTDELIAKRFEQSLLVMEEECLPNMKELLNYSRILGNSMLRHEILSDIGIRVCPYCNRNYITWYKNENNDLLTTADLDHYYQKDDYPLFALSLFNFIPSCQVCNSRLKGINSMEETLYPFDEGFGDDAAFQLILNNNDRTDPNFAKSLLNSWLGIYSKETAEYKISISIDKKASDEKRKKIENTMRLFRLEEIYSTHFDKALDIAIIARNYDNPDYKYYCDKVIQKINKQLQASELSIFEAYYDAQWLMFGYHWKNDENEPNYDAPLSRMTRDIFRQYCNQHIL